MQPASWRSAVAVTLWGGRLGRSVFQAYVSHCNATRLRKQANIQACRRYNTQTHTVSAVFRSLQPNPLMWSSKQMEQI